MRSATTAPRVSTPCRSSSTSAAASARSGRVGVARRQRPTTGRPFAWGRPGRAPERSRRAPPARHSGRSGRAVRAGQAAVRRCGEPSEQCPDRRQRVVGQGTGPDQVPDRRRQRRRRSARRAPTRSARARKNIALVAAERGQHRSGLGGSLGADVVAAGPAARARPGRAPPNRRRRATIRRRPRRPRRPGSARQASPGNSRRRDSAAPTSPECWPPRRRRLAARPRAARRRRRGARPGAGREHPARRAGTGPARPVRPVRSPCAARPATGGGSRAAPRRRTIRCRSRPAGTRPGRNSPGTTRPAASRASAARDDGDAEAEPGGGVAGVERPVRAGVAGHQITQRVAYRLGECLGNAHRQRGTQRIADPAGVLDSQPALLAGDAHPDGSARGLQRSAGHAAWHRARSPRPSSGRRASAAGRAPRPGRGRAAPGPAGWSSASTCSDRLSVEQFAQFSGAEQFGE